LECFVGQFFGRLIVAMDALLICKRDGSEELGEALPDHVEEAMSIEKLRVAAYHAGLGVGPEALFAISSI